MTRAYAPEALNVNNATIKASASRRLLILAFARDTTGSPLAVQESAVHAA
jgi:hypothetical protein